LRVVTAGALGAKATIADSAPKKKAARVFGRGRPTRGRDMTIRFGQETPWPPIRVDCHNGRIRKTAARSSMNNIVLPKIRANATYGSYDAR
jgi:hypothetical protein